MIRDEFKNIDSKEIKKKTNKEMKAIGERAYYVKHMSRINECLKPATVSTIITTVAFVLLAALYILAYFVGEDFQLTIGNWVVIVVAGICIVWSIVWFVFLKPHLKKKAAFYKSELTRISNEYLEKSRALYNRTKG